MQNSIEQFFVFFPALAYYTLYKSTAADKEFCILIALQFFAGRVLFLGGYLGVYIGTPVFRGLGFFLTLSASVVILLRLNGIDALTYLN
jgi:MAPEG family